MSVNVIHPDGESPEGAPTRNATILRNSYFLDRFLWSLLAIAGALIPALGIGHVYDKWDVPIVVPLHPELAGRAAAAERAFRASIQPLPFDRHASIPEQFGQLAWNVFTWEPVTLLLLGCGVLAVAAQRYAY